MMQHSEKFQWNDRFERLGCFVVCYAVFSCKYKASVAGRIKPTSVLRAATAVSVLANTQQALKQ
jgi:hypothetical protein